MKQHCWGWGIFENSLTEWNTTQMNIVMLSHSPHSEVHHLSDLTLAYWLLCPQIHQERVLLGYLLGNTSELPFPTMISQTVKHYKLGGRDIYMKGKIPWKVQIFKYCIKKIQTNKQTKRQDNKLKNYFLYHNLVIQTVTHYHQYPFKFTMLITINVQWKK